MKGGNPMRPEKGKEGYMPIVYICSPYRSDPERNTEKARGYCRIAVEKGAIPFCAHILMPQYLDDTNPDERALAMKMNRVFLGKCSELWVFGDEISEGMEAEIGWAKTWKRTIRLFTEEGEEKEIEST